MRTVEAGIAEDPSGGGSGEAESGPSADEDLRNTGLSALEASILALLGATLVILAAAARSGADRANFDLRASTRDSRWCFVDFT